MKTTELCVADCMNRHVITVKRTACLGEAIRNMDLKLLGALPVVDDLGRLVGIVSNSDIVGLAYFLHCNVSVLPHVSDIIRKSLTDALAEGNSSLRVLNVMTTDVATISANAPLRDAAKLLIKHAIHHLPVVDEHDVPIGIISSFDIVRTMAE